MLNDELCLLSSTLYVVVPNLLKAEGNFRSPWPNVDDRSGGGLYYSSISDMHFHLVIFAASRVIRPLSNLEGVCVPGLPTVRPMSVTTHLIQKQFEHVYGYISLGST